MTEAAATQGTLRRGLRAYALAMSVPWAIRTDALDVMLRMARRDAVQPEDVAAAMSGTPAALSARLGRPLDNAHRVAVHDGVAVIPVNGPIFRYASLFAEVSGATSVEVLARDLRTALDDPSVRAILLEIDSPGGEVAGTAEFAGMVRAASSEKPVHAYVDDLGASAAYWISSAAQRIIVAPTALIGSIGVVSAVPDPDKARSADIEFVSSQSPRKRADVRTEGGRSQVQAVVDAIADVFVADVARYRGVDTDTVLSDFGQGGVLVGQAAVSAGLVDAVGTFEAALAGVAAAAQQRGGGTARPKGAAVTGMRERFFAWLDGLDAPASADQEAAIVTANIDKPSAGVPTPAPTPPPADAATTERMTALEAENAALRTAQAAQAAQLEALAGQNKAMVQQARRDKYTAEVTGKGPASGIAWVGEIAQHVAMLEHLADAVGEDSPLFAGYVQQQRATAEQARQSRLFGEAGSGYGSPAGADPVSKLTRLAQDRVTGGQAKSFGEAMGQLERAEPLLFAEYQDAVRAGAGKPRD